MAAQNITLKFASSEITLSAAMLLKALKCIYGVHTLSVFFIMCMDRQIVSSKASNHAFFLLLFSYYIVSYKFNTSKII